jgi:hypothetical protein
MDNFIKGINPILSLIVVVGGGAILCWKPELKTEVVAIIMVVVGYHFGSSKGSQNKDETIQNQLRKEG